MYAASITNEEINRLELRQFEEHIHLTESREDLTKALRVLSREPVVGFDTESKPAFKKGEYNPIALIQLSTETDCYLVRVNKTGVTDELKQFLESPATLKIGIALRDDIKDLKKLTPMAAAGFLDLSELVKPLGIESNGLRKLTAIILGFRISKSAQVSNWENDQLTKKQLRYAATDAWVCVSMYRKLERQGYLNIRG